MIKSALLTVGLLTAVVAAGYSQEQVLKESIDRGQQAYLANCTSCHMESGEGVEGTFPPLINTDYVTGDPKRLINIMLMGQTGEIKVNGKTYNMDMPSQAHLTDEEVADVLNYIRNSWGNKAKKIISATDVKAQRQ